MVVTPKISPKQSPTPQRGEDGPDGKIPLSPKLPLPPKNAVAGFVAKLFRMVTDSPGALIQWTSSGASFVVFQPDEFSRLVLPHFFKHNNFSSFVRQLNMYGFHKVPQPQQGSLLSAQPALSVPASDCGGLITCWEFSHEHFVRGQPDRLHLIKRKTKDEDDNVSQSMVSSPASLQGLQMNMITLMQQQEAMKTDLEAMHRESRMLWGETIANRERHQQQQQLIDKILQFLATVFANPTALGINPSSSSAKISDAQPSPDKATTQLPAGKRSRLLLEDNPEFKKSVLDLIQYSNDQSKAASNGRVVDMGTLRDRIVDLGDTNKGVSEDIGTLQNQLASFLGVPSRPRSSSPTLIHPHNPVPSTVPSPKPPVVERKRAFDADEALFDELLSPMPLQVGTETSRPSIRDDLIEDPIIGPNAPSDEFDINTYFTNDN